VPTTRRGGLDAKAYDAGLRQLLVEGDAGDYWMLGADCGEWYWHDGQQWARCDPTSPEDMAEPSADAENPSPTAPTASARRKWLIIGCGGLMLLLIFACMVALVAYSWLL
jgi:hypothetical protein